MDLSQGAIWFSLLCFITSISLTAGDNGFTCGINGLRLAKRLRLVANEALGIQKIQEIIDRDTTSRNSVPDGPHLLNELAKQLEGHFGLFNTAVKRLRNTIESSPPGNETNLPQCCKIPTSVAIWSPDFSRNITTKMMCYIKARDSSPSHLEAPPGLLATVQANLQNVPQIKWQYIGNEEGLHMVYPGRRDPACNDYDPRLRPWYLEAFAPGPKDIVVAFDATDDGHLALSRKGVITLLKTTNPNDRIGLVIFGYRAHTPPGSKGRTCYNDQLAVATPRNLDFFIRFINEKNLGRIATNFIPALEKAFSMFKKSPPVASDRTKRRKLLIFFTDSDPAEPLGDRTLQVIEKEWNKTGEEVVLQTYGVGTKLRPTTTGLLKRMANITHFKTSHGASVRGEYTSLDSERNLRFKLKSYYNVFSDTNNSTEPVVTVPYVDFSGLGLVVSICMPVYRSSSLFGVTCVDARVSDLFYKVSYFQSGIDSYAFLVDTRGRAIVHPLLPKPVTVQQNPIFMDISTLERAPEAADVIRSMLARQSGSKTFLTPKLGTRGVSPGATVNTRLVTAHYHWAPVPNTPYSLCIVLSEGEVDLNLTVSRQISANYLHPYDLRTRARCVQQGVQSTLDASTVEFAREAYNFQPSASDEDIRSKQYTNYFTVSTQQQPEFRPGVRKAVILSGEVDTVWKSEPSPKYGPSIYRRHLVTTNGVMRMYPGASFDYIPAAMPWYNKAISNRGQLIFLYQRSEYYNAITASHVCFEGRANGRHSPYDHPLAVVAAEFRPEYFHYLLEDTFPACKSEYSCFLVDDSGFLLTHRNLMADPASWNATEPQINNHLMAQEPAIAMHLLTTGYMTREHCNDFDALRVQHTLKISVPDGLVSNPDGRPSYELHLVFGTNIFIGMVNISTLDRSGGVRCHCLDNSTIGKCQANNDNDKCECPCYTTLSFDYCNNTFPLNNDAPPTCPLLSSGTSTFNSNDLITDDGSSLHPCYPSHCHEMLLEGECQSRIGCAWCFANSNTKACMETRECTANTGDPPTSRNRVSIIAAVVGIILILSLILLALCLLYKYRPHIFTTMCSECKPFYQRKLPPSKTPNGVAHPSVATIFEASPTLANLPPAPPDPGRRPPATIPHSSAQMGVQNPAFEGSIYWEPYLNSRGTPDRTKRETVERWSEARDPASGATGIAPRSIYLNPTGRDTDTSFLSDSSLSSARTGGRASTYQGPQGPQGPGPVMPPHLPGTGPAGSSKRPPLQRGTEAATFPRTTSDSTSQTSSPDDSWMAGDGYTNHPITPTRRYTNTYTGDPRDFTPPMERSSQSAPAYAPTALPPDSPPSPEDLSLSDRSLDRPQGRRPMAARGERDDRPVLPLDLRVNSPDGGASGGHMGPQWPQRPVQRLRSNGDGEENPIEDIYFASSSIDSGIEPTYGRNTDQSEDQNTIPKEPF